MHDGTTAAAKKLLRMTDDTFTETIDGRVWAERKPTPRKKMVDGRRLELPTSALRTRRSPN
jgi:hypothetical protein